MSEYSNHLSGESSLYLLQHASNPVNWYPWSDEAWNKAKKENKLVLVSIGYSSCHWCHVMEKETFMDTATARIMNEKYICIKVDREERPDIDQVYMNAVQLMSGQGGWPLNCFTLPDGRPIYGGTYFPNANWNDILIKLNDFYKENPDKADTYADELTKGINQSELVTIKKKDSPFSKTTLQKAIDGWKPYLDNLEGGPTRSPKFPLPNNYQVLMRYAFNGTDKPLIDHVILTLNKIAFGGIYDQIAGGFSRYSTDSLWKVPHFEKMLYDNAQLVCLYSQAYKFTHNELYKQAAIETIDFLKTDMSDGKGAYFSAIDADSEGEEGKYYVWTLDQIKELNFPACGKANGFDVVSEYFNLNKNGYWENDNYILLRRNTDDQIAEKFNVSAADLKTFIDQAKSILKKKRSERIPPALDKKIITSWNALHISALCNAYEAFGDTKYRDEAILCAKRIIKNAAGMNGKLQHTESPGKKNNFGYLEDYAFTISACIDLYQSTFDESWLNHAKKFADDAIDIFYDQKDGFFWFSSNEDTLLIARKKETSDNVIPSSNSEMANALYLLGNYFDEKKYSDLSTGMLSAMEDNIINYPSSYSNWANLMINYTSSFNEIVIVGNKADFHRKQLSSRYLPNSLFAGSFEAGSSLSLLENRFQEGKTLIYICSNKTCKLPVESEADAISLLKPD